MSPARPPLFILAGARSGSTLLRLAMNAHPDIASPPELHLLKLGQRLLWTQQLLLAAPGSDDWEAAIAASRQIIDGIMRPWTQRQNAKIWCEKSVTSVNHLDILRGLFPAAGCIVLLRHPADLVASGLEAIAERPEGYDFEAHLAADPLRPQALLRYWLDRTEALVSFSQRADTRCVMLRYEELVSAPDAQLARIAAGLDLSPCPGWSQRIYRQAPATGPGDGKAYVRRSIDAASVGRGAGLAWEGVSRNLVRRVDRLAERIGYAPLESKQRITRSLAP